MKSQGVPAIPQRFLKKTAGEDTSVAAELARAPAYLLKGFCMGSADIIPGVSGGTMALILGIYERLLASIRSFDGAWLRDLAHMRWASALARNDLLFLLPLLAGIVSAILFFTRVVPLPALIVSHPEIVYGLFFGLILASILILMGEVTHYGAREIVITFAGAGLGLAVVNMVPLETPIAGWFIFLCGFLAICAMLLPGISGSFVLLILGKYAYIIHALGTFDLFVIATFAAGAVSGLAAFSRVVTWLLRHYRQPTLLLIKGMLIGSLWVIWPFQERVYTDMQGKNLLISTRPVWPLELTGSTVLLSLSLALAGFALVVVIHRAAGHRAAIGNPGSPKKESSP